ncbi:MAG: ABC transporter permease protein [candidate division TM6 bacterium GW2011_GWF2_32_72]|nr:MAG: ABC transporter permease protein [candidate division TM6 bacterium GW2011_GWF2_32_72]
MKSWFKKVYASLKKYLAIVKISFSNKMAYTVDLISEILFLTFIFSILYFLYLATSKVAPSSPVEKLSLVQTMWIVFCVNVFVALRGRGVSYLLKDEILSGQIAYQLNRPYSYIIFHFAQDFGTRLPLILFGGPFMGLFVYFLVGIPQISVLFLLLGVLMLFIGAIIAFLIQFCIGLCAFWIGDVDPIRWIYLQIMVVAGGASVPLAFFPVFIRKIVLLLPFSNVAYGASRILVGCHHDDVLFYLGMQIFWLIMMLIITKILFRTGVKNVVICGG